MEHTISPADSIDSNHADELSSSQSSTNLAFKYIRGEVVGKGSYASVYLGLVTKTGEMIAVKQIDLQSTSSFSATRDYFVEVFRKETKLRTKLNHENIVQYLGYEENPQSLSIFLEYVPGGSIRSLLDKSGSFQEDITKLFTSQILSGLEYLHAREVIHQNLTADNILVETSGVCKISGFGMSNHVDDINNIRTVTDVRGTLRWMAPEMVRAEEVGVFNVMVDIWGVGCVVLEMWSGELPWGDENEISVQSKLYNHGQPPIPANLTLDPIAEQFRIKCFEINPMDRPTAAQLKGHQYLQLPPNWIFSKLTHDDNAN